MSNTVVIIPTRLKAKRFPNKPLKLINQKEMILHVYELAKNSNVGDVLVTTPDKDIANLINKKMENHLYLKMIIKLEPIEFTRRMKNFIHQSQK